MSSIKQSSLVNGQGSSTSIEQDIHNVQTEAQSFYLPLSKSFATNAQGLYRPQSKLLLISD